ncbi:virB8 family protein [Stenoxybacter acetivorans]|uniref:virB8 family protein n=1 Tax=Stenoxybacter acetivorans TaxID=422441 RepID=UPI00055C501A|nr:type IV secretion system protein [Stenoxybacter acetivorans]
MNPNLTHTDQIEAKKAKQNARQFIQAAAAFEQSEIERVKKTNKIAWRIAIGSLVITALSVVAVVGLTPLKQVQPFVIRVDNNTGATDIVTVVKQREQSYGEVIDKYWLAQYVRQREGYDWQTIQDSYDTTMLLSSPPIQQEFAKIYSDNPQAPHKILKDAFKVVVNIKTISFIGTTAQVRFDKKMIPISGDTSRTFPPQPLIATIAYEYSDQPLAEKDRLINPLGFQVMSYRVDPENAP